MRDLTKLRAFLITLCITTVAWGQAGKPIFQATIRVPRDAFSSDVLVQAGGYQLSLVELDRETWFALSKDGNEAVRDLAIEIPATGYSLQGLKSEVLRGEEYFRVRVRREDKVYLIHLLLKGNR